MKYKDIFKKWWFWIIVIVMAGINSYLVYLDYSSISLMEIIGALIFDFLIIFIIYSILWCLAYILSKTFNRK